jgi:nucleoside-diphosphate-sugar epimerase
MEKIPHPDICFMRLHTVYSDSPRKNMFFDKLLSGTLEYVTDHERDFIHLDDVCKAIKILIESSYTGSLDIGTGATIKISDICPNLPIVYNTPFERQQTRRVSRCL